MEEIDFFTEGEVDSDDFRAVATGVEDFEGGFILLEAEGEVVSVDAVGHDDIGEEEVDGGVVLAPDVEGGAAGGGFEDGVTGEFEDIADEFAEGGFIFDDEDSFVAGALFLGFLGCGGDIGEDLDFVDGGEVDLEDGAAVEFTGDGDPAAVLFNDAVDGGEAESGAFADFFRGEEGFEDMGESIWGDTAAGIGDFEEHVGAGVGVGLGGGGIFVDGGALGADEELAAFGHGVAAIDGEVEDNLFEHDGVDLDVGEVGGEGEVDGDTFADGALHHIGHVFDELVGVEHDWLEELFSAEGEELSGEVGGAFGSEGDLLEGGGFLGVGGVEGAEDFCVALDDGEEVIEVVGDAAGELADGFHFLGLAELIFELDAFGDVPEHALDTDEGAAGVVDG